MNSDGLNGTCSGLGSWNGEEYEIADECEGKVKVQCF